MTIPRIQQDTELKPLPEVRVPASVPLESLGSFGKIDLSGVSRAMDEEWQREKQKADQIAVTSADSKAAALETNILYDPDKGLLNLKGQNALQARSLMEDQWRKGVSDIAKGLHNDTQRMAFQRAIDARFSTINETVSKHISTEMTKYDAEQTQNLIENEGNAAIASIVKGVPLSQAADRSTLSIARQRAAIMDFSKRMGWSKEQTDNTLAATTSQTHAMVISQMLANGDDMTAKAYYDEFKGELVGKDLESVTKQVEVGSLTGEAQRHSDSILNQYPDDEEKALDAARQIKDPELRDETEKRVQQRFQLQEEIQRNHENDMYLRATQIIDPYVQRGAPFVPSRVIPPAIWSQLSLPARTALERRALHADTDFPNDNVKWHDFLDLTPQQLGSLNRQEFESRYWTHFDRETRSRAEIMWAQARDASRTGKLDARMSADATFKDLVKNSLGKVNPMYYKKQAKDWSKDQYDFYADFMTEALRRKEQEETAEGKPLTRSQMQDIMDQMVRERVFVKGSHWWNSDKYYLPGQITNDEKNRAYVPIGSIPDASANELRQMIKDNRGNPQDSHMIERLYAARLMNDPVLFRSILSGGK